MAPYILRWVLVWEPQIHIVVTLISYNHSGFFWLLKKTLISSGVFECKVNDMGETSAGVNVSPAAWVKKVDGVVFGEGDHVRHEVYHEGGDRASLREEEGTSLMPYT